VARHEAAGDLRLFELGHVFWGGDAPLETAQVLWLSATPKRANEPAWSDSGFRIFKGEAEAALRALTGREAETVVAKRAELHPGKSAALRLDGIDLVVLGAIDPRLLGAYAIASSVYAAVMRTADLPAYHVPRFAEPSRFPALERDLALVVAPDVPAGDIERAVRAGADGVVAGVNVFDEYRGPQVEAGKKSVAVRITLQRHDGTLTDAQADEHVGSILALLEARCGAKIRT